MGKDAVGIDVSKDSLDVATYATNRGWHFPNSRAGISQLTQMLTEVMPALVVLEATGGYETPLAMALRKAAIPCAVLNPREVRDFAKATKKLAKTDMIDAHTNSFNGRLSSILYASTINWFQVYPAFISHP